MLWLSCVYIADTSNSTGVAFSLCSCSEISESVTVFQPWIETACPPLLRRFIHSFSDSIPKNKEGVCECFLFIIAPRDTKWTEFTPFVSHNSSVFVFMFPLTRRSSSVGNALTRAVPLSVRLSRRRRSAQYDLTPRGRALMHGHTSCIAIGYIAFPKCRRRHLIAWNHLWHQSFDLSSVFGFDLLCVNISIVIFVFFKTFLTVFVCILIDGQFNNYNSLFFTPTSRFSHWPSLCSSRLNVTKTLNYVIISSSLILGRHFPGDIHDICSPESHFELSSLQIYNNNNNFPSLLFPSGIIVGTAVAKSAWSFPFSSVLLITTRVKSSFYSVI